MAAIAQCFSPTYNRDTSNFFCDLTATVWNVRHAHNQRTNRIGEHEWSMYERYDRLQRVKHSVAYIRYQRKFPTGVELRIHTKHWLIHVCAYRFNLLLHNWRTRMQHAAIQSTYPRASAVLV